jgi:hypothetical protein
MGQGVRLFFRGVAARPAKLTGQLYARAERLDTIAGANEEDFQVTVEFAVSRVESCHLLIETKRSLPAMMGSALYRRLRGKLPPRAKLRPLRQSRARWCPR